jgi:O-antigen/teichoic acid export membrane protein
VTARTSSTLRSRVVAGLGANASGQVVSTVIQLASVPAFLHVWSVDQYGHWLLLSAMPAYLALGDIGLGTVAMNRMTMLHATSQHEESRSVFQTALLMTSILSAALFVLTCIPVWLLPLDMFMPPGSRGAMTLLVLGSLLNLYTSLFDAVFRASGEFARGTYLINLGRLLEWLGGLAALLLGGTMVAVALGSLATRVVTMLVLQRMASRRFPLYPWGFANASSEELRKMLRPALSFLSFPLGNALTIQGMSVVVGTTLGPAALAVFNTYRTLSRLPIQLLATFSRAIWPEISRRFGAGDLHVLRRIYRQGTVLSLVACAAACAVIFGAGDWALRIWTSGDIPFEPSILAAFLLTAFGNCAWQVGQVVLSATNTHERLAATYLGAAALCIIVSAIMPTSLGLIGAVAAMGLFEAIMFFSSHRLVISLIRGGWRC